jgi:asparagine synthase (glutamine-hydrolysing)
MCGICGKVNFDREAPVEPSLITRMLDVIRHRGPDDEGLYISSQVGLGHRRLSIIDLNTGHQPISNEDGSVWIVFNGEIYNYKELRSFLLDRGHQFKTLTDTEVIVHLYEELGPACIQKLRGMFAFAIWDNRENVLLLARDRVGIKPLYFAVSNRSLVFGSEIKAILADPDVDRSLDPEIIDRFLTFLYLPGEQTMLRSVRKLAPGSYLILKNGVTEVRRYWDLSFEKPETAKSPDDACKQLLELLGEAVEQHMISDVPVGILLSGGVDSTAVLSLARTRTDKEISSFTVGFSDSGVADERPYARIAAEAYGTRHHEITISPAEFADCMPKYVWHMEEPVCEPPAIALYYVSKLASKFVKVLLSGEGGDEAFAGYSNYRNLLWLERIKRSVAPFKTGLSRGLSVADSLIRLPRLVKYAPLINASFPDYYFSRTSNPFRFAGNGLGKLYSDDYAGSLNRERSLAPIRELQDRVRKHNTLDAMLYIDTKSWLPDDLLVKADKMTMANSVELRVPLLDHKLLEFAAALPPAMKIRGFTTKYLAKKALRKHVPPQILQRTKAGFPVPYESWLTGSLRGWVRDILLDRKATNRGYFAAERIEKMLSSAPESSVGAKEVFSLVTLELWHRAFA